MRHILLDTGPLGLLSNPSTAPKPREANAWAEALLRVGEQLVIPEIADYEVRRELLRARKSVGLRRLDELVEGFNYMPLSTRVMRLAAEIWAKARQTGQPTAADAALDGDVILAAQARDLMDQGAEVEIATMNPAHLSRFAPARLWHEIG